MSGLAGHRDKGRTLFIGLDAGDAELIERWCAQGLLPNIAAMRSRGAWARLRTTAEITHVSAWPSIFTGTTPDKHGLYHAFVTRPGHQGPLRPRPDLSPFPFLWKLLSDQGKRCVIIDAFLTCPLTNFNGLQIVDWGSWTWFWEPTILPASLKRELHRKFGLYPAEDHSKVGMAPVTDHEGFRQRLLAAAATKTQVVRWLMDKEDWDFFLVLFGESHPAGHYFWHFHDPSYLTHPPEGAGGLQHALRDVYVALDKAVGEILSRVDARTTVFLVSGDGMGPNYSGSHILDRVLGRMGLLHNDTDGDGAGPGATPEGTDFLKTLRNMIPEPIRIAVTKKLLPRSVREALGLRWKTSGIAWDRTRAFQIENANEGYVRINLKGREPRGTVAPGPEYESLCEGIYRTVGSMTNPTNGRPAARTVHKTDDVYRGPCRDQMPDIIIHWNDEAQVTTQLLTEDYGLARVQAAGCATPPYYTGNHRADAFMIALGPQVPPGSVIEGASTLDLAPTILAQFGIEPPASLDGRILGAIAA